MNILIEPHKHILRQLVKFNVEFILIGGYAVNFHGYNRATGDMDVWLKPDNENKKKFIELLQAEKFSAEGINKIRETDFSKPVAFHIGEHPMQVDFLTFVSGVNYADANEKRLFYPLEDIQIPMLHLHHLVISKMTTGRSKDKLDIDELQKANKGKSE